MNLKDKFYLFARRAHDEDIYNGQSETERIASWSRISPREGAHMLGIKNIIMVSSDGNPGPFSCEAYGYMESFYNTNNVWWSFVGIDGFRLGVEEDFILSLTQKYSYITGAFATDLFTQKNDTNHIKATLERVKKTLSGAERKIEIWSDVYTEYADVFSDESLYEELDGVVVWSRDTDEIPQTEEKFEIYEKLLPTKKKMLGICLFDYAKRSIPTMENFEFICELGRKWIKEGRIDGVVFRSNCNMGLGLKNEYWLRNWIDKVGEENI